MFKDEHYLPALLYLYIIYPLDNSVNMLYNVYMLKYQNTQILCVKIKHRRKRNGTYFNGKNHQGAYR